MVQMIGESNNCSIWPPMLVVAVAAVGVYDLLHIAIVQTRDVK